LTSTLTDVDKQRLAEEQRLDCHVHRIAHIAVLAADYELHVGATGAGVPRPSTTNRATPLHDKGRYDTDHAQWLPPG